MVRFGSDAPFVKLFVDAVSQFASGECTVAYPSPAWLVIVAFATTYPPRVPPVATHAALRDLLATRAGVEYAVGARSTGRGAVTGGSR